MTIFLLNSKEKDMPLALFGSRSATTPGSSVGRRSNAGSFYQFFGLPIDVSSICFSLGLLAQLSPPMETETAGFQNNLLISSFAKPVQVCINRGEKKGKCRNKTSANTESSNVKINDNQMKDLTQGSIVKHLLRLAAFLAVSLLGQTLYFIVDLYWVGHLGKEPLAAVGVAGNLTMMILGVTQVLRVGTTTLISQATGEKNQARAEVIFNQSFVLSLLLALTVGACAFLLRAPYCGLLSADAVIATLAESYLLWFIPALLLQFPLGSLASALNSTGAIKPAVGIQLLGIAVNIVIAPLLIFGIGPWPRLGVTGAGLASFVSVLITDTLMVAYFKKMYHYLRFRFQSMRPQINTWSKMLCIGVPAGAEFMLTFFYFTTIYGVIRNFGPAAQAGFGIGSRVVQVLLLPVLALSLAVPPVVGQNFWGTMR